ncbi:acyl carrier protein [uncultured Rhodospira sp.]|uniref:acyl carrier protein n=1 Tax=uncultured Rhodospira sp. TaxID=1936189 RepID=UPI002638EB97|nr:acyl carrier protein [uncultured Rhodospira sp.]
MNTDKIRERVMEAIEQAVGEPIPVLDLSMDLDDLGIDSLTVLRLQNLLESSFGVKLPDNFVDLVKTGEDIIPVVEKTLGGVDA